MNRGMGARLAAVLLLGAGTLADTATAPGEDVLVVEGVLRTDQVSQRILLHRTLGGPVIAGEPGARVSVTRTGGPEIVFVERPASPGTGSGTDECATVRLRQGDDESADSTAAVDTVRTEATCYLSPTAAGSWVVPGAEYRLRIRTRDGLELRGRTRVPGRFAFRSPVFASGPPRPGGPVCRIPPSILLPLAWSPSDSAWAYLSRVRITGLRTALPGVAGVPNQVDLTGLSISRTDTTLVLPTDFGLFEAGDLPIALFRAIAGGLPAGTRAELTLAATDRNYVNSVRGGSFNPSGPVRIPSVAGDGTGVFGSIVPLRLVIEVVGDRIFCAP